MLYSFLLWLKSQLTIYAISLLYFYAFRFLLSEIQFLTYWLISSSCLTVPVCPIKFETILLPDDRLCIFHNSVHWLIFVFSINYRETPDQGTTLFPAAKWCQATYSRWIPKLVIYDQSSVGFHKEPEGLIISFLLKVLSNIRQVKQPLNPVGKW